MSVDDTIRKVFCQKAIEYQRNYDRGRENGYNSPIFDILNAASRLGLLNTVMGMLNGSVARYGKGSWFKYVQIDDVFWQSTFTLNNDCMYLYKTVGCTKCRYVKPVV